MTVIAGQDVAPFDIDATEAWWLVPERLFDGETLDTGRAVRIVAGRIDDLHPVVEAGRDDLPVWRTNGLASPGFFDVQVNGGGGVMVNGTPTADGLRAIAAAHRPGGTTAILPTLITDAPEVMEKAVSAVIAAVGRDGIVGVHLEGPHISVARKGAHNPRFIRPIDGRYAFLCPAPARRQCARPPDARAGMRAAGNDRVAARDGRRRLARPYRGRCRDDAGRDCGGRASGDPSLQCDDAHHLARAGCRGRRARQRSLLWLHCRRAPCGRCGAAPGNPFPSDGRAHGARLGCHVDVERADHFTLYGETIRLEGGKLVNSIGSLAGVHTDMATSLRRLVDVVGVPLEDALKMATANPSRLMRLEANVGFLRPGMPADIVLLGGL
jgi:N-acetylglucosamine-6-phosphate deacetylase